jgi:hypothetical protein
MSNDMFTQLPSVASALPTDIICAVQANVSVQETLQQVSTLFLSNTILFFAGNPNGSVAGVTYQLLWDTVDQILYVCTVSGNAALAVWTPCIGQLTNGQLIIGSTGLAPVKATLTAGPGISIANAAGSITISGTASPTGWTDVTGTTQAISPDQGYTANNAGLVTFTLPTVAAYGTEINIIGKGAGGWLIAQNAGQNIQIGAVSSTVGVGGSVASSNRFDAVDLICTLANTTWTTKSGPEGNLTIV